MRAGAARSPSPEEYPVPIANFPSAWMSDEHRALEDAARRFFTERWVPQAAARS